MIRVQEQTDKNFAIHTFGIGALADMKLLRAIASFGKGSVSCIADNSFELS